MSLTITVDDEVLRWARIRAPHEGTSVDALLRDFLESHVGSDIQAARAAGCSTVLSEDFQALQDFGSVTVVNPFE